MVENGYVTARRRRKRRKRRAARRQIRACCRPTLDAAGYFAEEVRRELLDRYGEKKLYEGGLSVRTTLDPKMQADGPQGAGRRPRALSTRRMACAARSSHIDISGQDWGVRSPLFRRLGDVEPWRLAVVLDVTGDAARIGLQPATRENPAKCRASARPARFSPKAVPLDAAAVHDQL